MPSQLISHMIFHVKARATRRLMLEARPRTSHVHPITTLLIRHWPFEIFVLCSSSVEISIWNSKRIQMKNLSTIQLYNFSRSTTFALVVSSSKIV